MDIIKNETIFETNIFTYFDDLSSNNIQESKLTFSTEFYKNKLINNSLVTLSPNLMMKKVDFISSLKLSLSSSFETGFLKEGETVAYKKEFVTSVDRQFSITKSMGLGIGGLMKHSYYLNSEMDDLIFKNLLDPSFDTYFRRYYATFSLYFDKSFIKRITYTDILFIKGSSIFDHDSYNEVLNDELGLHIGFSLYRLFFDVELDYDLVEKTFRRSLFDIKYPIHCWYLNLSFDFQEASTVLELVLSYRCDNLKFSNLLFDNQIY